MAPRPRRRGEITSKAPGSYLVRVYLGTDPLTGRKARLSQTVRGSKTDAQRVLTDLLSKQDRGAALPRSRLTLGEWLAEFERTWSTDLAPQTRENAVQALRCYLPPALLATRLPALRAAHFQELYNTMAARGLAPATISFLHRTLKARLSKAVKLGHLAGNPLSAATPPAVRRREYRVFTPEEARVFLEEAAQDDYAGLWILLLATGLRPAEALGLRWSDLDGPRLAVRRALVRTAGGRCDLEETKTRKARTITLPASALRALQRHRARQGEHRLRLGSEYRDQGLMFAGIFGQPLRWENVVRRHFTPVLVHTARRLQGRRVLTFPATGLRRATRRSWRARWDRLAALALQATGLDRMRPYDLRHTAATLLMAAGEHPKVVSELLGHAKITLTLDTYSHVVPALMDNAARRMDALLEAPAGPAVRRG
jgi:integrase